MRSRIGLAFLVWLAASVSIAQKPAITFPDCRACKATGLIDGVQCWSCQRRWDNGKRPENIPERLHLPKAEPATMPAVLAPEPPTDDPPKAEPAHGPEEPKASLPTPPPPKQAPDAPQAGPSAITAAPAAAVPQPTPAASEQLLFGSWSTFARENSWLWIVGGGLLLAIVGSQLLTPTPRRACNYCGGVASYRQHTSGSGTQIVLILLGIGLCFTVLGACVGIPIILLGFGAAKVTRRWECPNCGVLPAPPVVGPVIR